MDSLFNFLVRGVRARVEDASGQVLDETNALGNADLLLLGQLAGQTMLARGGVVHLHRWGPLLEDEEQTRLDCSSSHGPIEEPALILP